jgi:hypothetical protein
MTEKLFDVDGLRILSFKMSCEDQFRLATFIAENVGYVLVAETDRRQPDVIWIDGERYKLTREDA